MNFIKLRIREENENLRQKLREREKHISRNSPSAGKYESNDTKVDSKIQKEKELL